MGPYIVKMIGYVKRLVSLGMILDNDLAIDFVLQSLLNLYRAFITNYVMIEKEKNFFKLLRLLRIIELEIRNLLICF